MDPRFEKMRKISKQPAMRLLAMANGNLVEPRKIAASALVPEVMTLLARENALADMLQIMSVALPARERVWWACLAARDLLPKDLKKVPLSLELAETWVRKPVDETRHAMRDAIDLADVDDETVLCATAALFGDETLGPGELKNYPAPAGSSQVAAMVVNLNAATAEGDFFARANVLVDRAVDIARGGNGQIPLPDTVVEVDEDEEEEEMAP